jgi:hypothetical protein
MLSQVVAARELLTTLVALKRLLLGVQRAVVSLQVFLATEASVAEIAHKGLGRVLSERLLAATAVGGSRHRRIILRCGGVIGVVGGRDSLISVDLLVARLRVASGSVHGGLGVLPVPLPSLVLVDVGEINGRGWAGERREVESVAIVEAQVLVTNEASVAQRHNRRAGAGTRARDVNRVNLTKVDQVAEVSL